MAQGLYSRLSTLLYRGTRESCLVWDSGEADRFEGGMCNLTRHACYNRNELRCDGQSLSIGLLTKGAE